MSCPNCTNIMVPIVSRMTRDNLQDILNQRLVLNTIKTIKDNWFCFSCFESFDIR